MGKRYSALTSRADGTIEPSAQAVGTTAVETAFEGQVFGVAVGQTDSHQLTKDEPRLIAKLDVLPEVEAASNVLCVWDVENLVIPLLVLGDEFGVVEQ